MAEARFLVAVLTWGERLTCANLTCAPGNLCFVRTTVLSIEDLRSGREGWLLVASLIPRARMTCLICGLSGLSLRACSMWENLAPWKAWTSQSSGGLEVILARLEVPITNVVGLAGAVMRQSAFLVPVRAT